MRPALSKTYIELTVKPTRKSLFNKSPVTEYGEGFLSSFVLNKTTETCQFFFNLFE
jgi:hypothetical protein